MRDRGSAIIFCRILVPPNDPSPDVTILNYLCDRKRGSIIFCRILAPTMPPPLLYADDTILKYLIDKEKGAINL